MDRQTLRVAVSFVHRWERRSVLKEQMTRPAVRAIGRGGTTDAMDTMQIGRGVLTLLRGEVWGRWSDGEIA